MTDCFMAKSVMGVLGSLAAAIGLIAWQVRQAMAASSADELSTPPGDRALVIVDMQEVFPASRQPFVREAVERHAREAIRRGSPIVLLEWWDQGPTYEELRRLIVQYRLGDIRQKTRNDGSAQVLEAFRDLGVSPRFIQVCGVNTHICVRTTAEGLSLEPTPRRWQPPNWWTRLIKQGAAPQVEILMDACNCMGCEKAHEPDWTCNNVWISGVHPPLNSNVTLVEGTATTQIA